MPDPTPIRGRWTIRITARGDRLVSDLEPRKATDRRVDVVPVPDERAINRAAVTLRDLLGMQTPAPDVVRAVLAAALEEPDLCDDCTHGQPCIAFGCAKTIRPDDQGAQRASEDTRAQVQKRP